MFVFDFESKQSKNKKIFKLNLEFFKFLIDVKHWKVIYLFRIPFIELTDQVWAF